MVPRCLIGGGRFVMAAFDWPTLMVGRPSGRLLFPGCKSQRDSGPEGKLPVNYDDYLVISRGLRITHTDIMSVKCSNATRPSDSYIFSNPFFLAPCKSCYFLLCSSNLPCNFHTCFRLVLTCPKLHDALRPMKLMPRTLGLLGRARF